MGTRQKFIFKFRRDDPSGRRWQPAKLLCGVTRTEGSNPSLSAIIFPSCPLAQLEVRLTLDQEVLGSSPRGAANTGS